MKQYMTYKGSGIYDNEDFSFIESCTNEPNEIEIGTCWIGDKETYDELINNITWVDSTTWHCQSCNTYIDDEKQEMEMHECKQMEVA